MKKTRGYSRLIGGLVGLAMMGMAGSANAVPIGFNISWTGSGGWTMTGMFSYDSSLDNTGPIDETQIDSLMIEVFLNAASQGTWDLNSDGVFGTFNFNFDTSTETFLTGGDAFGPAGQLWNSSGENCGAPPIGFGSGTAQGVCIDAPYVGLISTDLLALVASRKDVPEPSTLLLFGVGLAGLALMRRRHRRYAQEGLS